MGLAASSLHEHGPFSLHKFGRVKCTRIRTRGKIRCFRDVETRTQRDEINPRPSIRFSRLFERFEQF